ncbi:4-hydroxy-tetrahydrodipicolinate synthase [Pseudoxanthomonas winnipegensis]|uniref:4-hydroxy-tetrahydrodipicolinate synthase n=1 Tax=Pseudoxanthomonas winnipegensis TaxID=2480810 RepID=A0A4Q8LHJ2_9GAMM|nr:4-hydroxy-tetrahydrodipicolinate synthase [Pseudoxanthomonas winnipegensis]RZZ84340.1 4-hydroxy-tetrahydrodipicolinate synthase [Pseudoxanthomonas winnipegensis]TAA28951.1 4-hydroxy-tetrahydrodipicolinate synthase [Pseudoxanthomonas winnipegensis]TAA41943.1 4-hydroxy-tetrahydrodipicolinate synthase [Pseudoxanthomonas winnipegensis]
MFLSGCITALATPFSGAGDLDLDAWRALLSQQLRGGVQGVVVAGSTGEAATLSEDEYARLIRAAVEQIGGQVPVLAGTGQSSTARTIAQTRLAAAAGAYAALVVTPPYVRPTQAGLVAHYRAVAEQGGLPVVLYNVPGRTGCDLLPETVAELAAHPGIVGIKEAVADPARMQALLALRTETFAVLGGDDATACRALLAGADGLISVGANALPGAYRRLCDLARAGDAARADAWDAQLAEFHAFFGIESNPIPVKALLQRAGIGQGLRLPLLPLSAAHTGLADRLAARRAVLEEQSSREPLAA